MAEFFDTGTYIEGVRELMSAYNESGDDELYRALHELCYAPNEAALRENYARNAAHYAEMYDAPVLPSYDDLPVLLFPVTNDYSVLLDKTAKQFCMNEKRGFFALLHVLLFVDETAIPQAAERFRRAENEVRAYALAQEIAAAIRVQDFGIAAQEMAEEYHELCPHGELYALFHAEAALSYADVANAVRYGEMAYEQRKMSRTVCSLLSRAYRAAECLDRALLFCVLAREKTAIDFPEEPAEREKCLQALTVARTNTQFAPLISEVYLTETAVESRLCIRLLKELPRFAANMPRYWACAYNPYGLMHIKSKVIELMNTATEVYNFPIFNDFIFDIMKAQKISEYRGTPDGGDPVLLPVAAQCPHQMICFHTDTLDRNREFSEGEFSFYRVEEPVTFHSEHPFLVGDPIVLRHSSQRRKLVLNILTDGFSWRGICENASVLIPNILNFFSKGIIFDQSFSTAEYTYPALASIETGLYQHKTGIVKPGIPMQLDPFYVTASEQMKKLGYYCVNIQGDAQGIYNGVTRGFDRLIVNHWMQRAMDGVERVMRHLQAFDECDNFLFMHFADTHPFNADVSTPAYASVHLALEDVLQAQDREKSVFLKPNPLSQYVNCSEIRAMDRQLGYLFDYLTSHYDDDEYIVLLYSDHGTSVHARSPYLLSEEQTGAALMARGAGVPALGRVDELTSSVDIYKILGKLADYPIDAAHLDGNLPEAFGGQRRKYTVSNSIYPGQTYKICVRTERHAFHLETEEFTREDGTISLDRYTYHIHERSESYREVFDDALARYFMDIVWEYTESFRR